MSVSITTLVENSLGENQFLRNEHGLSVFIEIGDPPFERLLFDIGKSANFIFNARHLNIDVGLTDKVILSHGHDDHSGGLRHFVKEFGANFELLVGNGFLVPKYTIGNGKWLYSGNDFDNKYLEGNSIKTTFLSKDSTLITPGVYALTNFPRIMDFEKPNPRFYTFSGVDYRLDTFTDEIVLVIEVKGGLLVLLGCSHPGVANILDAVQARFKKPLYCVLGGTHLVAADFGRLNQTIDYLKGLELPLLGVCHCTGEEAMARMPETGKQILQNTTGMRLRFERYG